MLERRWIGFTCAVCCLAVLYRLMLGWSYEDQGELELLVRTHRILGTDLRASGGNLTSLSTPTLQHTSDDMARSWLLLDSSFLRDAWRVPTIVKLGEVEREDLSWWIPLPKQQRLLEKPTRMRPTWCMLRHAVSVSGRKAWVRLQPRAGVRCGHGDGLGLETARWLPESAVALAVGQSMMAQVHAAATSFVRALCSRPDLQESLALTRSFDLDFVLLPQFPPDLAGHTLPLSILAAVRQISADLESQLFSEDVLWWKQLALEDDVLAQCETAL